MANEFKAKNGVITPIVQVSSAGTAGAPAITKSDDLNTGIFFPSADTIAFAEGGTEVIRINSSSNVGIGTSSQDEKLVVAGAITTTGQAAANKTSSGTFDFYSTDNATRILSWGSSGVGGVISFWTGSGGSGTVERFRIATNGAIGLGGANYGTSGQVLTSNGSGSAPTWQTAAAGTASTFSKSFLLMGA